MPMPTVPTPGAKTVTFHILITSPDINDPETDVHSAVSNGDAIVSEAETKTNSKPGQKGQAHHQQFPLPGKSTKCSRPA